MLLLGTSNLITGNDNNLITSNLIRNRSDAAGIPANLVYSSGTVGKLNSGNILTYNELKNFTSTGVTVAANGNGDSWTLIGNSFYMDLQTPVSTAQIVVNFVPGLNSLSNMIGLNHIGGSAANCGGNAWINSGSVSLKGIVVNSNGTSVQGNEVKNISMTSTVSPQFYGIDVTGGPFNIGNETGNVIGDALTSASIKLGGRGSLYGIRTLATTGNNLIANNLIANMVISGGSTTSTANLYGIVFTCATVSKNQVHSLGTSLSAIPLNIIGIQNNGIGTITNQVSNNMISINGLSAQSALITGIQDMAAATGISKYFYNTVSIFGSSNISKNSYCFYRKNAANTTLTDNLLSNVRSSGTSAQYVIYSMAGVPWSSNYNDLYTATTPLGYYNAVNYSNLTTWRTGTSGDAQSINIAPVFVSPVNLHLTPANYLIDGKGTPLLLVTDDIDGQPRNILTPDIGADEFTAVYPRIDHEYPVLITDLNIYPNPFSGMTNISYTLAEESSLNIAVYNLLGERVTVIDESTRSEGTYTTQLNGNEVLPGIYLCRMVVNGGKVIVKRMEVMR
ncbi:MAG: T9SS type A sorting domain-containing protein [Bacteroidetes bacterium]|nr:T9SS type A sorting domain-containing protein [Bacteroidota bacterium]